MVRQSDAPASIEFGHFSILPHRRQLLANGQPITLGGRAFDVLMALIGASGAVVGKDELLKQVWTNRIVEENRLAGEIAALRKAFGADRELIRTVAGRGYQFTGEIRLRQAESDGRAAGALTRVSESPETNLPLPDKPSIAVLPFQNMSGDPEQEYFADGMVDEIITALSRIKWLFVIARNSSFTYKGQAVDVKQVGQELGVRYVLEGSVRKAGGRVRITGQLIDATNGAHLWADHFDSAIEDVFELQDKVASSVAGVIEPTLQAAETARSARRPTTDLTAYDIYLRAYPTIWSAARQVPEMLRLLEQAIARDPYYGPALAMAAMCCFRLVIDGRSQDPAADRIKGTDFARRALAVAGDDPAVLVNTAITLAFFGEDIGAMLALVDRALALNPSFARGWHVSGNIRVWADPPQLDTAIEHIEAALRLSPRARVGSSLLNMGIAHFFSRRFYEAVPKLLLAIQEDPSFQYPYRVLAACYAHMGRFDEAREIVAQLRAVTGIVVPDVSYLRCTEHRDLYLSGLRLAAGEPSRSPLDRGCENL
ncbi:MAG: winged helix-turn-helix domain-containing protein [Alphaproteobacteria bacterium]|nr:winged helix-turn-helix domain-containing protein [Alphaproteobacteria bacterium]